MYIGQDHSHSGGDWFEISPGGVLVVHPADPKRDTVFYAPNAWTKLETDQPPGPPTEAQVWEPFYT